MRSNGGKWVPMRGNGPSFQRVPMGGNEFQWVPMGSNGGVPACSLDLRSTELIVSPKKVVGCRGGSRNVEGCWEFPYLKLPNFKMSIYNFPNAEFLIVNLSNFNFAHLKL